MITGGASGFGAGFAKLWASKGAYIIIGDVSDASGKALVEELRKDSGSTHHHFLHCDVTNWQSQVDFFRSAAKLSPTGYINGVVANAGITDREPFQKLDDYETIEEPKAPDFKCFNVNILGVMYTAKLALFWLEKSKKLQPSADRHLLLIGSVASLAPIPGLLEYSISKHGVLGLFRSLRATSFVNSVRVNMLCPYFIETPLIPAGGRVLLAGAAFGKTEDVVDAGTRLMSDESIVGRALVIGPKVKVNDEWELLPANSDKQEIATWEPYAHDYEEVDVFTARMVRILNQVERAKGWIGYFSDIVKAVLYGTGLRK